MKNLERVARGLLQPMNPFAVSLLGGLTVFWGLWIVNPFWSVFSTAQVYSKALEFAPEWAWGTWATCCGMTILYCLLHGGTRLLAHAMLFCSWHWFTVSCMLWWGDWQNTAGLTYLFVALYSTFSYLNIKANFVSQGINRI